MPTGAELIVSELEDAGVDVVFGLPGVHNLALWEALRESSIRLVGVRHEQTAAYAADGYARASGRLGVALTTTGPGAANTLGAVGEAWASRSPILVIATDIPTTLRREGVYRGALHETDGQADMFRPVTERVHVATGDDFPLADALEPAQRPVYFEVPTDLLRGQVHDRGIIRVDLPGIVEPGVAGVLAAAQRPLLWVGSGARDAGPGVAALAEKLAAPILTTYGARGVVAPDHPCVVEMPPHAPAAGRLWDEADVVVAIGSDLDGMNTQNWAQPQPPTLVAINLDPADAGKNYRVDHLVQADAATACAAIAAQLPGGRDLEGVRERLRKVCAEACAQLDERALEYLDALSFALPDDSVVVADMCIPGYWIAGFRTFAHPRKLLYPVGWGTLGFAFPAAVGAALAGAGPTVAVCGDGGFLFAAGELATIAQEDVPLTTVIVDDGGYGMLRFDQLKAGEPEFGVDLRSPDFEALAGAFGVRAETVEGLGEDFGEALARHVEDGRPSVLVARMQEALPPPPTTSPQWYRRA
jgi:thiamine pyrophosphate-dependent acetolactate synthase large subunit-like protein